MTIPVRPEEVPDDIICSICMSIPLEPVMLSPCEHVFCRGCIDQSFRSHQACPVDRSPCNKRQMRPFPDGSLIHRIWSSVTVKCESHEAGCCWTGSIADYTAHQKNCRSCESHQRNEAMEGKLQELQSKIDSLQETISDQQETIEKMTQFTALVLVDRHDEGNDQPLMRINNSGTGFTYAYNRDTVVELTQLICKSLEELPESVDGSKLFCCVKNCYDSLRRKHSDNPPRYYDNMRMLLAVCAASEWFTVRQHDNIVRWLDEQGWS